MFYAAPVWCSAARTRDRYLRSHPLLHKLTTSAARQITHCLHTTPINILLGLAGLPDPAFMLSYQVALRMITQLRLPRSSFLQLPPSKSINFIHSIMSSLGASPPSSPGPHPLNHIHPADRKVIPFSLVFYHFKRVKPGDWAGFTDGSVLKSPGPHMVGWASPCSAGPNLICLHSQPPGQWPEAPRFTRPKVYPSLQDYNLFAFESQAGARPANPFLIFPHIWNFPLLLCPLLH